MKDEQGLYIHTRIHHILYTYLIQLDIQIMQNYICNLLYVYIYIYVLYTAQKAQDHPMKEYTFNYTRGSLM